MVDCQCEINAGCRGSGCGMAPDSEGFANFQRTMAGYARHPKFGGLLVVGLGCEINFSDCLLENMHLKQTPQVTTQVFRLKVEAFNLQSIHLSRYHRS